MKWNGDAPCALVRTEDPDAAFAAVGSLIGPPPVDFGTGVHSTAVVAESAKLGKDIYIGPCCVIEPGAVIGDGCVLVANCYIGHNAVLGNNCQFYPYVSLRDRTKVGSRVVIHSGTVIGADGFGYAPDKAGIWQKIPQSGIVEIGDDVEIGANSAIDRARFGITKIGNGTKIDNFVQIAHNVTIGNHTVIAAHVGISGSAHIGSHVMVGGQAGFAGHIKVGDGAMVGAGAGVTKDVPPKIYVSDYPAVEHRKAARAHANLMRLPLLKERVKKLEAEMEALKKELQS
jgi:UDP-3-O-[3-hydroxymyristoyl] glucosamine N-acyltransferase